MQAQEFFDCMTPEGTKQEYSDIEKIASHIQCMKVKHIVVGVDKK